MSLISEMVANDRKKYEELMQKLNSSQVLENNKNKFDNENNTKKENLYNNLDLQDNIILNKMLDCKEVWTNGNILKQKEFIDKYINITSLKFLNNDFYNINGFLGVDKLRKSILEILSEVNIKNLNAEIKNLVELLKIKCFCDNYNLPKNKIYVKNGLIILNKNKHNFEPTREFTTHLLNSNYTTDNRKPKKWLKFLNSLFNKEDIDILQEYLGYCLLPTTDGQKCLFIIGKGGEGKSVIGKVLNSIFGNSMISLKLQKLLTNKFSLAQLNGKLVVFEDELQDVSIKEIDTFKSLITGNQFSIEEKYAREQQVNLYARFIILGNNILKHKNCTEYSFQRRLLLLLTKEKDVNRIDNPNIHNELIEEKDLIFMWLLKGLERLLKNNYQFSHKEYMKFRIEEYYKNEYSKIVESFINNNEYIEFVEGAFTTFNNIENKFRQYCINNSFEYNQDKFSKELSLLQNSYNITKDRKYINGSQVWGYYNISIPN